MRQTEIEIKRLQQRERNEPSCVKHPAFVQMLELKTLNELARNADTCIYIRFDKHTMAGAANDATKDGN